MMVTRPPAPGVDPVTTEHRGNAMDNERLIGMVSGIEDAIKTRQAEMTEMERELAALDGTTCIGREWWRDKDHPRKEAKLYINHSIDQACPLHGKPEPGGRLRVYVGSDFANIADVREAMDREVHRQELERRLRKIQSGLSNCGYSISRFYDYLGYDVGMDGQPRSRW